jgi:outer membrane protein assembly factor BamE
MRNFLRLFTLFVAITLVGCGAAIPTIKPYKMDIQQGNVVTSEMLLKLRPGMTKSQVRFIMGTPLLVDSFHRNRWDYFYQLRKQGQIVNQRRVILDFDQDGLLKQVRGDVVPKGQTVEDVKKKLEAETSAEAGDVAEDPNTPVIKKIETPDVEVVEPTPEPPPADTEVPELEAAKEEAAEVESSMEEGAANVDVESEPIVLAPVVEPEPEVIAPAEAVKEEVVEEAAIVVPAASEAIEAKKPAEQLKMSPDKSRVFRLDRQLDASRVKQNNEPKADKEPEESVVQEIKESDDEAFDEEEPSFFERMLEKIGF